MSNVYKCFWNRQTCVVKAGTSYEAQALAWMTFKAEWKGRKRIKPHEITVVLAEKDGKPVIHSTAEFG